MFFLAYFIPYLLLIFDTVCVLEWFWIFVIVIFSLCTKTKTSLKNIQENGNIIIKEADKGSAVVILDKTYYKTKIQEILKDETNYKLIDTNIDNNFIQKIIKFCRIHSKSITKKEKDFLNYIFKTSNFYGLPKIHTSKQINKKHRRNTKIRIYRNPKPQ